MRHKCLLPLLALAAGLFASCEDNLPIADTALIATPASQEIGEDGSAGVVFTLMVSKDVKGSVSAQISLVSTGGFTSPMAEG